MPGIQKYQQKEVGRRGGAHQKYFLPKNVPSDARNKHAEF